MGKLTHEERPEVGQVANEVKTAITEALLRGAKDRADFAGAETAAMSIAALRTTVEDTVTREGEKLVDATVTLAVIDRQGNLQRVPEELIEKYGAS